MKTLIQRLENVRSQITTLEQKYQRQPGSVQLLAVSKTRPADDIALAMSAGQMDFGENYLQDALSKINVFDDPGLQWHFIGPIQSNKTQSIAQHFQWVHTIDRLKIARRLSEQRPTNLPPLNVCIQVNISEEASKSGVMPDEVLPLAREISQLPGVQLRGLMAIPAPAEDLEQQRQPFAQMRQLLEQVCESGIPMDTLSMGMSNDMEAAIAEGATIVRIGTAIFGPRAPKSTG